MLFQKTRQQDIGNSREARLYQGLALRVCAVRPALTEPSLPAPPEGGKGDGAAGAPHLSPPAGLRFWGLFSKSYPQILRTRHEKRLGLAEVQMISQHAKIDSVYKYVAVDLDRQRELMETDFSRMFPEKKVRSK